jgi:cytochrome c biogenesis protein CcmG, thiol:disulfide interchange protein DsbE
MNKLLLMLISSLLLGFALAQGVNQTAPDFTMYDTAGKIVKLSSFKGKPVVVTFWATWCEVCQIELPALSQRYAKLKSKLVFLAVSRDPTQSAAEVTAFVQPKKWSFSHVLVNPPQGAKNADTIQGVTGRYRIFGQPWSFFIAADGTVKAVHAGLTTEAEFDASLTQIGVK